MFTDTEFMTAGEKGLVLKSWERFLQHGLRQAHFTRRLYQHLHLHCGFIAHYNLQGFYAEYFQAGQDIERFFDYFCTYCGCPDYADLHRAMCQAFARHKATIMQHAEADVSRRIAILEANVQQAKEDPDFAKRFLSKISR